MRASKATLYEESCHVPFVVRWPNAIEAGTRTDAFFGAIDIVPTLLGACGVPLPEGLQGRDISSVWQGGEAPADTALHAWRIGSLSIYRIWHTVGPIATVGLGAGAVCSTERYTYARWFANERGPWLFDRQEDPLEMINLANSAEARPALQEMEERLHRWMEGTKDPFEYGRRGPRGFFGIGTGVCRSG